MKLENIPVLQPIRYNGTLLETVRGKGRAAWAGQWCQHFSAESEKFMSYHL